MGIDYFNCISCGEIFPDCDYVGICANCENWFCKDCHLTQIQKYGVVTDEESKARFGDKALIECIECTNTIIRDVDVLNYLLLNSEFSKQEIVDLLKKEREEFDEEMTKKVCFSHIFS